MSINFKNDKLYFYSYNPYQIKVNRKTFNHNYNLRRLHLENITKLSPPSEKFSKFITDEFKQTYNQKKYKYYKQKYTQQNKKPILTEGNFHEKYNNSPYSRYLSSDRSKLEKVIHICPNENYSITEGNIYQNNTTKNSDTNSIKRLAYRLASKRTNSFKSNDYSNSVNLSENDVFYYNENKKEKDENIHNIIGSSTNLCVTQSLTQYPFQNLTNKISNTTDSESKNNRSFSQKKTSKDENGYYKITNPGKERLSSNYNKQNKIRLSKIDKKINIWKDGNLTINFNNTGKNAKIYNKKNNNFSLDNKFKNKNQFNGSNSCKDFYKKKFIEQENKYNIKNDGNFYKNINNGDNIDPNNNYYTNSYYYSRDPSTLNVIKRNTNPNKSKYNSISKTNTIIINNNITKNIQNFKYWNNSSKNIYKYNPFEKFGEYGCQLIEKFCEFFDEIIYFQLKSYLDFFFYQIKNYIKNKESRSKTFKKNEIKKSLYGIKKTPIHYKGLRSNIIDSVINSENYYSTFNDIFRKPVIENNSENYNNYLLCNGGNNKKKKHLSMNINNNDCDYYYKSSNNDDIKNFYAKVYFPRKRLTQTKSEKSYISMDDSNNIITSNNDNNNRKTAKINSLKKNIDYIENNSPSANNLNLKFKNIREKYKELYNLNINNISSKNYNISKNTHDPKKFKTSNNSPENIYQYNTKTNIHITKSKKNDLLNKFEKENGKENMSIYHKKFQNQKIINNIYSKPLLKKLQNIENNNINSKSSKLIKNNGISSPGHFSQASPNKKKMYLTKDLTITESAKINIEKTILKKIQKLKCYIVKDACSKDKKLNVFIKYYFNNDLFTDKNPNINNNFVIESLRPISLIPKSKNINYATTYKKTNKFLQDILTSIIEEDEKSKANRSLNNSIISEDDKQLQSIKNIINSNFMRNVIIYLVGILQNIFDSNKKLILFAFIKNLKKINYNLYLHKTLEQFNANNNNNCHNKSVVTFNNFLTEKKAKRYFNIDKCHTPKCIEYSNQLKDYFDFSNHKHHERISSFPGNYKEKNEFWK